MSKDKDRGGKSPSQQVDIIGEQLTDKGKLPTKAIFKQYNKDGTECLDKWRATFVKTEDPTEYKAAIKLLGSWADWEQFKANWPQFTKEILPQWHLELEMRIRSNAMEVLIKQSKDPKGTAAAKFIMEGKHNLRKYVLDPEAEVQKEKVNGAIAKEYSNDIRRLRNRDK